MIAPLHVTVPPSTSFLAPIRALVTAWLQRQDLRSDRWCLVVTELVTNAMAVTSRDASVTVVLTVDGEDVELAVGDDGPGVTIGPIASPDPSAVRGRGLMIVNTLTHGLASERKAGRTVLRCRRAIADDLAVPDAGSNSHGLAGSNSDGRGGSVAGGAGADAGSTPPIGGGPAATQNR